MANLGQRNCRDAQKCGVLAKAFDRFLVFGHLNEEALFANDVAAANDVSNIDAAGGIKRDLQSAVKDKEDFLYGRLLFVNNLALFHHEDFRLFKQHAVSIKSDLAQHPVVQSDPL